MTVPGFSGRAGDGHRHGYYGEILFDLIVADSAASLIGATAL